MSLFDNLRDLRTGDRYYHQAVLPLDSIGWNDLELTDGSFDRLEIGDQVP